MVSGTVLKGRYQLRRFPLPHRGLAEVWPADDTLLERSVIVKLIGAGKTDLDLIRRFRRETLLTARLDHPGVPAVYDLGEHEGRPYVVLERIAGLNLADLIAEQGPLPIGWVAAIGAQISSVLMAAQRINLVHRDIKPSNVMLAPSSAVKVLDFGLAVVYDDDRYSRITRTEHSLGTKGYMAPEQTFGERVDHRTDLYGLGGTLFDLLTGQPPFVGATTTIDRQQIEDPPPRPAHLRPDVPATLDDLVQALLATRPEDRPASAAEVYTALAPLSRDLPPIPGLLDDTAEAVQAYAAIVGRVPQQTRPTPAPAAERVRPDREQGEKHAERLHAAGEFRAAARQWRQVADQRALQYGDDDLKVFDLRRQAARAHLSLGERDRALRQLNVLLRDRIRVDGPEHATVQSLRQEIARLSAEPPSQRHPHRRGPDSDH
ncbi:serine/threonine-protein kinase [Polymorphospora sp. NPDC050346]|uniref:serine/threonine-protein kinase n=1 Tax=Polymorphospora sp. NPDC050346 TaxID=3155780 RepID=UPI0033DA5A8A